MAELPTYTLPLTALAYDKPSEDILEKEKFANNGEWFLRMNRWVCFNFFNPFSRKFTTEANEEVYRMCSEMYENFAYYYGRQTNKTFAFMEPIVEANTVQAVYVPDQTIRKLIDHAVGIARKMIDPIPKSFSATILAKSFLSEHDALRKKLEAKQALTKQGIIGADTGVVFAPEGIEELADDGNIDDAMESFLKKQTIDFVRAAQGLYYSNKLDRQFEQAALHQFVGNVSTFKIEPDANNDTQIGFRPCYNSIVDTRATDDYLSDAMCSGFVEFLTAQEVFEKYGKWLNDDQRKHISAMCNRRYQNITECLNFYHTGWGDPASLTWWWENGKVSVTTTYWIGKKDVRYRIKDTKYGSKLQWLENEKEYAVVENGVPKRNEKGQYVTQKGEDIKGDDSGWFVHKCSVIGNCIPVDYGYAEVQIRKQGKEQKPLLPTVQFVHRMNLGYARSIVSRLKQFAEERGMLKLKIQELVGKDMGMVYVLWADKMALTDQSTKEIFKDFRSLGFTLINKSGEDNNEPGKLTADALNFSLQATIGSYIQLVRETQTEMESIINMPAIALGQQADIIGKGVQETTINQASLGQVSLYSGLQEHYRQVLAYALNVEKTVNAGKTKIVSTGEKVPHLVTLSKKWQWEEIGLHLEISDDFDQLKRKAFLDGVFAFGQNGGTPEALQALSTTMKLLNFNSTIEAQEHLDEAVKVQKKEAQMQTQQAQQAEFQSANALQTSQQIYQTQLTEMQLMFKSFDTKYTADSASLTKVVTELEKQNTAIGKMLMEHFAAQPPNTPLQQQTTAQIQQAQEPAPPA